MAKYVYGNTITAFTTAKSNDVISEFQAIQTMSAAEEIRANDAIKFPAGEGNDIRIVENAAQRIDKVLMFDDAGDLAVKSVGDASVIVDAGDLPIDDAGAYYTDPGGGKQVEAALQEVGASVVSNTADIATNTASKLTQNVSQKYALASGTTDLDTLVEGGFYSCNNSALNYPAPTIGTGQLTVKAETSLRIAQECQIINADSANNKTYIRSTTDGGSIWTAWIESSAFKYEDVIATTSGTGHEFTSIPSWVKKITVTLDAVSSNGTGRYFIQLGDSGGYELTVYTSWLSSLINASSVSVVTFSDGMTMSKSDNASASIYGTAIFTLVDPSTNLWACIVSGYNANTGEVYSGGGRKELSGTLDRLRLYADGNTFDAGKVNALYEG